MRINL